MDTEMYCDVPVVLGKNHALKNALEECPSLAVYWEMYWDSRLSLVCYEKGDIEEKG